jgi:hypothetical protein
MHPQITVHEALARSTGDESHAAKLTARASKPARRIPRIA